MVRMFFVLALFAVFSFTASFAHAQASLDLRGNVGGSGIPGGSIMLGFDSATCDGSIEGAIRYNSASSCAEYCDGTDWVCPSSGGSVGPTNCDNVGDLCDDGSYYIGDIGDGDIYATDATFESSEGPPADAGGITWRNVIPGTA